MAWVMSLNRFWLKFRQYRLKNIKTNFLSMIGNIIELCKNYVSLLLHGVTDKKLF